MDLRPLKRSKRIKAANKSRSDCQDLASSSAATSPRSAQAALLQSSFSENKGAGRKRKELHEPSRASPSKRPRRNCDELGAPKYNLRSMATCATKDYTERDMEREEGTVTVDEGLTDGDLKTHGRRGRSKKLVMDGSSRRTKHTLGPDIEDPCGSGPEAEVERKERQGYRVISEVGEDFHDECSQEDDEGLSDSSQNGGNNIADPNPEDFDEGENDEDDEDDGEEEEEEDFDGGELTHSGFPGTLRALTGMMSGASSRFRAFLNNLRQTDDPTIQLITLQELSEMLLVSNEDALSTFLPAEAFVLVLVKLMQPNAYGEENPDVMLLACRCLANLMEVMPSAMPSVVYGGAVSVLCQKLLEIQFIDVAEQALSTLEKISVEFPSSVIREGGLGACLNFLDFFSTSVQRVAITTAANSCRTIPMDCFPAVRDAIPVLQNVISGNDQKVVEQGCICVARIVENFRHHPQNLEQLMSEGLLGRIVSLLLPGPTSLISPHTYTQFVRVLALVAKASPKLSAELLKLHVVDNVYQILTGISPPGENGQLTQSNGILVMQTLSHRPKDQIYEALNVACELLPALPKSGVFDVGALSSEVSISKRAKRHAAIKRKFEALASCQNELVEFATLLLPVLTGVYLSTVNLVVRQKVLSICIRILAGLQARLLSGALHSTNITSFLATILSQNDHSSLNVAALQLADVLRRRFPKHFVQAFEREGLVAEIEKLTNRPNASEDSKKAAKVKLVSDDLDSASQFSDDLPASSIASASPISSAMSHSTVIANSPDTDLQGWLQRTAQSFLSSFEVQKKEMKAPDSSRILKDLKKFSTSLSCSSNIEDDLKDFSQFLVRDGQDSISSHELLNSGIIDSMLDLLGSPNDIKRTARAAFLKNFLLQTDASPFVFLVQKLQELLSKLEHFEVVTVHPTYSESGRSSIASMLAKQMRLKLIAADEATVPRAYKNIMVSIHAIATFKSLEDYLRPRLVQPAGFTATLRRAVAENGALSTAFSAFSNASQHSPFELVDDEGGQPDQPAKGDSAPAAGTRSKKSPRGLEKNGDAVRGSEGRDKTAENVLEVMDEKAYSDPEDMSELLQDLHDHHEAEVEDPTAVSLIPKDGKLTAKTDDGRRVFTPTTQNTLTSSQASSSKTAKNTSYADALRSTPQDWHVEFSIGNQVIDNESTIYGAIHKSDLHAEQQDLQRNMWASVYPVRFRKAEGPPPSSSTQNTAVTFNDAPSSFGDTDSTVGKLLRLLDTLYAINAHPEDILFEERDIISAQHSRVFVNNKLTAKLNRQLEEPLIVASCSLPQWCEDLVRFYPFLFPFESRHLFLQSTSFGYSRSMWRWQNTHSGEASSRRDELRPSLGRLIRQKVRIARGRMLESGIKVMELYGCSPSVLEVEYFEEVGSGLGPTLEFYSSVSLEFAKRDLHIWRDHDLTDGSYISSAGGLFPAPMDPRTADSSNAKRVLRLFKVLGQFVARSMLDGRIIDIRFNPVFFRIAEAQDCVAPSLGTVSVIDPDLAKSLNLLQRFQLAKEKAENEGGNGSSVDAIEIDGCKIDDVSLDFTLPGCPHIDLIEHGAEKSVTIHNVAEYTSLVIEWTMKRGVELQINAFREGFSLVFPFTALRAFFPDELVILFGKVDEDWSLQTLTDCIKADHGFNMDSDSVQNLLSVLHAFDEGERRSFLQFATGSPKLPIGGFKNLTPRLTVVCKPSEAPLVADDYLPSVMTCVNYLKLPDYSSRAVLRARLRKAVVEGQGAFHLS